MGLQIAGQVFSGLGPTSLFASHRDDEKEITQGKQYILSIGAQAGQIYAFDSMLFELANSISCVAIRIIFKISTIIAALLGLPLSFFIGVHKMDVYSSVAGVINTIPFIQNMFPRGLLPSELSQATKEVFNFLADHLTTILMGGMVLISLLIIVLGDVYFGIAALLFMGYYILEQYNCMPNNVVYFMKKHIPYIASIGFLCSSNPLSIIYGIFQVVGLISTNVPIVNEMKNQYFDSLLRYFGINYMPDVFQETMKTTPSVKEIEKPVIQKKNLSQEEMQKILLATDDEYKINAAACSIAVSDLFALPVDKDFDKFLAYFKEIHWEEEYNVVLAKVLDDRRFMEYFKEQLSAQDKNSLENLDQESIKTSVKKTLEETSNKKIKINELITNVASQKSMTKEQFLASWIQEQMKTFVHLIKHERLPKGDLDHLELSIEDCQYILAYLNVLHEHNNPYDRLEIKDFLLTLSVEAGDYCTKGIKRATKGLLNTIISKKLPLGENGQTPERIFEVNVLYQLEKIRTKIVEAFYSELAPPRGLSDKLYNDEHFYSLYRIISYYGFGPLTQIEKNNIGIGSIFFWDFFHMLRGMFSLAYKFAILEEDLFKKIEEDQNNAKEAKQAFENEAKYADTKKSSKNQNSKYSQKTELTNYLLKKLPQASQVLNNELNQKFNHNLKKEYEKNLDEKTKKISSKQLDATLEKDLEEWIREKLENSYKPELIKVLNNEKEEEFNKALAEIKKQNLCSEDYEAVIDQKKHTLDKKYNEKLTDQLKNESKKRLEVTISQIQKKSMNDAFWNDFQTWLVNKLHTEYETILEENITLSFYEKFSEPSKINPLYTCYVEVYKEKLHDVLSHCKNCGPWDYDRGKYTTMSFEDFSNSKDPEIQKWIKNYKTMNGLISPYRYFNFDNCYASFYHYQITETLKNLEKADFTPEMNRYFRVEIEESFEDFVHHRFQRLLLVVLGVLSEENEKIGKDQKRSDRKYYLRYYKGE
jgi:hypothetical protein